MNFKELDRELRSKKLRPIYYIYGEESYLTRTLIDGIKTAVNNLAGSPVEVERFSGKKDGFGPVVTCCTTQPMWNPRRLVIVDEASSLKFDSEMERYFEKPTDFATLILTDKSLDGRTKFGQFCKKLCAVVECKPLYENQVPEWVRLETESMGKKISMNAAELVVEFVGVNLGEVRGALEKLVLYVGKKPMIDTDDVDTVLTETSRKSIFNFLDRLGNRDMKSASKMLDNLFSFNENEVMILTMLSRHIRLLIKTREAIAKRNTGSESLASILKVPPFLAQGYLEQARKFTTRELARAFKKLYTTDRLLKSSKVDNRVILKKCVRDIMLGWN